MARTFYFQLIPEGLGTPEVECLVSYIHRLAAFHGVTLHQLLAHLGTWWKKKAGRRSTLVPRQCQNGRLNGYSPDIDVIIGALEAATGLNVLRSTTLLAMKNILAANGTGVTKLSRAWCPICYSEDKARGSPIYDRLMWQLQGVNRCLIHRTPLTQQCQKCGEIQRNQVSKTSLAYCERCNAPLSLVTPSCFGLTGDRYELRHVASLLEFTSANPSFAFDLGHLTTFCELMVTRYTRRALINDLGDVFHRRWYDIKPQLTTMFAIATYFDVPLLSILTSPSEAAAQIGFDFDPIQPVKQVRDVYNDPDRRERSLTCLKRAISGGPPYPTMSTVCTLAGVSTGYLRHNFQDLVARLSGLRRRDESESLRRKNVLIQKLLKERRPSRSRTVKRIDAAIAREVGTSIHHVRQVGQGKTIRSHPSAAFKKQSKI